MHTASHMASLIQHRGPDDVGAYCEGRVALAFRRLSILDLSPAGHQPFESEDGSIALVFNGEIFNFVELRDQLRAHGHVFRSTGDTEVLLRAYQQWGVDCLRRFNGMWAFLLHDRKRDVVFGSRDRFGVKPLYQRVVGDRRYFASEIKALRAAPGPIAEPNWSVVARFLGVGRLEQLEPGTATFFAGIEEVPAATGFEIHPDGTERRWRFWEFPDEDAALEDPVGTFRELLTDAVRLRLRSDVPVGVSLSGGLDSTSIISLMARERLQGADPRDLPSLHAFSYMPPEFDEAAYVMATIDATGAELHRTALTPEALWDGLPTLLRFQDEPVHSATALVGFEIYRMAAAHDTKVILCGQGADEVLGGYSPYFADAWYTRLRRGQLIGATRDIMDFSRAHGRSVGDSARTAARRFLFSELNRVALYRRGIASRRARAALPYAAWLQPDLVAQAAPAPTPRLDQRLPAVLRDSVEVSPLPLYLRIEDRNSMAHSVEARLPFLDYRVVEHGFRLAPEWKLRGRWNKYVLRQAMRGTLPDNVRERVDKMGFPTPVAAWMRGPLRQRITDVVESRELAERGLFDVSRLRAALNAHVTGEADHSSALFNVVQLDLWLRQVDELRPPVSESAA